MKFVHLKRSLFLAIFVLLFGIPFSAFAEKTFTYVVPKKGETCDKIAKKVYGDVSRIDLLHKYNDLDEECWLGKKQKLPAGLKLILPDPPSAGTLTGSTGKVNSKPPTLRWKKAKIGQDLFRAWQVNTFERSQAEVTFRDTSLIKMRENTLIVIYGASKKKARTRPTRARLEKGTLRTAFDSNAGGGMIVETPSSNSEVKSKSTLVSVEEDGTTRVANHGRGEILVRSNKKSKKKRKKKRKAVKVKKGMGTKIEKGKEPEPPRKLPDSPAWKTTPTIFLSYDKKPTTIFAEWNPVPQAKEYYVEVSRDNRGVEVLQTIVVPKNITRLEVQNLPAGDYFASVSTIDDDQFESLPMGPKKLRVRSAVFKGDLIQRDPFKVYIGGSFRFPKEVKCGDAKSKSALLKVNHVGSKTFECIDNAGQTLPPLEIIGVAPTLAFKAPNFDDQGFHFPESGAFLDLSFEPRRPTRISLSSDENVKFGNPIPIDDKVFRIRVYGKEGGQIQIKSGEADLGKFNAMPVKETKGEIMWSFGMGLEAFTVGSGARFTQPSSSPNLEPEGGQWIMVEAFGGVSPNENLSLELTLGLGLLDFDADNLLDIASSADYRLRALLGFNVGAFNPFFQLSAGAQTDITLEETIPVLGLGVGFNYWFSRGVGFRADGGLGLSEGIQDDLVFFPEVRSKLVLRW